jgi:AraC-like DNA-binding protein
MAKLVEIIKSTLSQFEQEARQEHIALNFQASEATADHEIDSNVLQHDLAHLLRQLLSYTPENGSININAINQENGELLLEVINVGIDLHVFTGLLHGLSIPASIIENGSNSTRFQLQIFRPISESIKQPPPQHTTENNFYLEIQNRLQSHFSKTENLLNALKNNPADTAFLTRINRVIEENISKSQFDVNRLAELMNMSRTQLFRKLKPIIRQSASNYIRSLRLQKAKELLETSEYRVSEIAFLTGFETPSHFSKVFVKAFGITPSSLSRHRPTETNEQENATN